MAFGVPADYRENGAITATDAGADYWNPTRVAASARYQWSVYELAWKLARERAARIVLDVGCGPATKLEALFDGFERYGVDQAGTIELCRSLGRHGTFVDVDLADPPTIDIPPADVVVCADVVEHLADPFPLFAFVRAHCAPDGLVIFSTPARELLLGLDAMEPSNPSHVREWSRSEFSELLRSAGFLIVERSTHLPFKLKIDALTARWLFDRARARRTLRSNQVVVCRPLTGT